MTLHHPVYHQLVRRAKWNGKPNVMMLDVPQAARLLRWLNQDINRDQHLEIAAYHERRAIKLSAVWSAVVQRASIQALGKPFHVSMYQVSSIARDEFAEHHKRVLRHACTDSAHRHLARERHLRHGPQFPHRATHGPEHYAGRAEFGRPEAQLVRRARQPVAARGDH